MSPKQTQWKQNQDKASDAKTIEPLNMNQF